MNTLTLDKTYLNHNLHVALALELKLNPLSFEAFLKQGATLKPLFQVMGALESLDFLQSYFDNL